MSLVCLCGSPRACRFPRVSGDEPQLSQWSFNVPLFSPRERG